MVGFARIGRTGLASGLTGPLPVLPLRSCTSFKMPMSCISLYAHATLPGFVIYFVDIPLMR